MEKISVRNVSILAAIKWWVYAQNSEYLKHGFHRRHHLPKKGKLPSVYLHLSTYLPRTGVQTLAGILNGMCVSYVCVCECVQTRAKTTTKYQVENISKPIFYPFDHTIYSTLRCHATTIRFNEFMITKNDKLSIILCTTSDLVKNY